MRRPFSSHSPAAKIGAGALHIMKAKEPKVPASQELVGIVISGMPSAPRTTVFSAYIWGPPAVADEEQKGA